METISRLFVGVVIATLAFGAIGWSINPSLPFLLWSGPSAVALGAAVVPRAVLVVIGVVALVEVFNGE